MRPDCCWLALAVVLLAASAHADDRFPYTAYVNADDVYVRSGPGQNYYPTSKLQLGEPVEVYRHDPGGWYAIRPPEGSFSWISGRYLKPGRDGVASVVGDRVVARVGSQFSDIRDVIQIRLERGELVEVLEGRPGGEGASGQGWYKIAPPAGEFRWISGKLVDRAPPEPTLLAESGRGNLLLTEQRGESDRAADEAGAAAPDEPGRLDWERDAPRGRFRPARAARGQIDDWGTGEESATRPAVAAPTAGRGPASDGWTPSRTGGALPTSFEAPGRQIEPSLPVRSVPGERPRSFRRGDPSDEERSAAAEFLAEIDAIEFEISQMVVEEPTVWSFGDLRTRAETALGRAENAVERGYARLALGKIDRFEEIKRRFETLADVQATTDRLNDVVPEPQSVSAVLPRPDALSRFDGMGHLAAVPAAAVGSPQFALLDEAGNVRSYITPAPGVNLRAYVGQKVGINGTRGFIPTLNTPHVTARRVVPLEGVLR